MEWHSAPMKEVFLSLKSNKETGLDKQAIANLTAKFGKNMLTEKKKKSLLLRFLEQFKDFMVIILLIASGISFITALIQNSTSEKVDACIILFIVIMNAIIGVVQESKAEKAIDALKQLSAPHAKVIREGKECKIASEDVVPGDILRLTLGDFVPADARIIESVNLKTEESALTGESLPVEKNECAVIPENAPISEQKNMVFSSSAVTAGHALAIVTETGMRTQVGRIAHMINEEEAPETPLQQKLAKTGKVLGLGALAICAIIFILGLIEGTNFIEMFMIAISLAVAAIPEGLPAIVTIVLALGVRVMAANRAIVRKLPAVETLGSASVICSDKTGTLTQNKMTVVKLATDLNYIAPESKEGNILLSLATLCNNSILSGEKGNYKATGEPTETALVVAAANAGKIKQDLENNFKRIKEIPFDSKRKIMTTVHKLPDGKYRVITKGAPDFLIALCNKSVSGELDKKRIEIKNEEMANEALRVIAVAFKDIEKMPGEKDLEKDLTFCGLIGMIDPPRPQAKKAVSECKTAGIKPVMITGDHVITAKAIARDLGILSEKDQAMTGQELEKTSQEELEKKIYNYSVFARVSPEHKVRIVKAFQARGAVVAMTGDGVNDAPALKTSDIGCAMGRSGTEVAKSAADMIMTDDNFATIVEAVRQGRGIYDNIRKTVYFLLSSNIGEIVVVLTAFILNLPTPLLATQLLWVNLVTDTLPALALGVEPVEKDIMTRKPINKKQGLFAGGRGFSMSIEGAFIGAITFLAFVIGTIFDKNKSMPDIGRTMAFVVLGTSQLFHAFNVRSEKSIFKVGVLGNKKMVYSFFICLILQVGVVVIPLLTYISHAVPLNSCQWLIIAALSISPIIVVEIEKFFMQRRRRS